MLASYLNSLWTAQDHLRAIKLRYKQMQISELLLYVNPFSSQENQPIHKYNPKRTCIHIKHNFLESSFNIALVRKAHKATGIVNHSV